MRIYPPIKKPKFSAKKKRSIFWQVVAGLGFFVIGAGSFLYGFTQDWTNTAVTGLGLTLIGFILMHPLWGDLNEDQD